MKIEGVYCGEWFGPVFVNDEQLELGPSFEVVQHSPDGFAWGYSGSGPSQLAMAILLKAGLSKAEALRLYHKFRDEFLAGLPRASFSIDVDVATWTSQQAPTPTAVCDCGDTGKRDCPRCGWLWEGGPQRAESSKPLAGIDTVVKQGR